MNRAHRLRRWLASVGIVIAATTLAPVIAAERAFVLRDGAATVRWAGGPLTGAGSSTTCTPVTCDQIALEVRVPAARWRERPGGVVVRIEWADRNQELDLSIYGPDGELIGAPSNYGGVRAQQVFVANPEPGTYRVEVAPFAAVGLTYRGEARIVSQDDARATSLDGAGMRFAPAALVDPQLLASEPGVWVAGDDVLVGAIWSVSTAASPLWRSTDGGRTFERRGTTLPGGVRDPRNRACVENPGGGDVDIAVDRNGTIYTVDLYGASVSAAVSHDDGATWSCAPVAASGADDDRPWVAVAPGADGDGPAADAYLAYRTGNVSGQLAGVTAVRPFAMQVDVTRDAGRTWTPSPPFGAGVVTASGPIFTGADGALYQTFEGDRAAWLARSTDDGRTFSLSKVSSRPGSPGNAFVTGAVDHAGTVYVAWVDDGSFDVLLARSFDGGRRWTAPRRVNPPGVPTAVMPWVAAGRDGDVAVAWYGTDRQIRPDAAPATVPWHVWTARSLDGDAAEPTFAVSRVSADPVHRGAICPYGALICTEPAVPGVGENTRSLGDFFEIAIASDGAVVATYNDDGALRDTGPLPDPFVAIARQETGLGMSADGRAAALRPAPGGSLPATTATPARVARRQPFRGRPSARLVGRAVRVEVPLAPGVGPGELLAGDGGAASTDALWLVTWVAGGRLQYAAAHADRTGAVDFSGGAEPVPGGPGIGLRWAAYPAMFPVGGSLDTARGTLTLDLPLDRYGLRAGTTLRSVQAFALVGVGRGELLPLEVAGSTHAVTVRVG